MNSDFIRITLYDKEHTKYFETVIRLDNKKSIEELNDMLKSKGTHIRIEYERLQRETSWV